MKTLIRILILFLAITGAVSLFMNTSDLKFSEAIYWDHHGFGFLVFITFFPRLTLLFSSVPFGGLFWWLGWFFTPRILVAILATLNYWKMNPVLVLISWVVALSGESGEKWVASRRVSYHRTNRGQRIRDVESVVVED